MRAGADFTLKRPFTVQAFVALPLGLPPVFTRTRLFSVLAKFQFDDYASAAFRQHRTGPRLQKTFIPIENLTSFTKTPLKKPLLKSVPKRLKKTAADLFELLLEFSGVAPGPSHMQILPQILDILKENQKELVDEFFMQLIKQTINNHNPHPLARTWELFLVVASVFPVGPPYMYVLAHCARSTTDSDQRIAAVAAFTFLRLVHRHYLDTVYEYTPRWLQTAPVSFARGSNQFECLIYECLWSQRCNFPKLPIPYILYYMVTLMLEHDALITPGLFRTQPKEALVREIIATVNDNVKVISKADVHTLAALLRLWLRGLPNPTVPIEMLPAFEAVVDESDFLPFAEKLPQAHYLVLLFVIGFLQEVCENGAHNGCDRSDLAVLFGPCFVNPERGASGDVQRMQRLNELGTAFCKKLIEAKDTRVIYPIADEFLELTMPRKSRKEDFDGDPGISPGADI
jgi:hypothetical protein